jgi:hypothetical protein
MALICFTPNNSAGHARTPELASGPGQHPIAGAMLHVFAFRPAASRRSDLVGFLQSTLPRLIMIRSHRMTNLAVSPVS